ncbi:hypothetical protein PV327_005091 [Microctonus hyperodae]|uniref:Glycosyl transferase CAP10 domain-containing protein n=1 Tax=Microctonus hyperodae TaxID=165561 RepID=A0AA39G0Y4_MICHY|nr:hypothetical protein PV327_005091 [Microctonus hyperodae]
MNYCNAIFIILIVFQIHLFNAIDVDPHKTIAWGPGLDPEKIVMRARYFFLQLVDVHGKNLTESPGETFISTEIKGQNKNTHPCRIWTQVLDCKDGSFIIRYRLYETCSNFHIIVKFKHSDVKPVSISAKGPVHEEECYCPNPSVDVWLDDYTCAPNYSQILEDLKYFPKINFDEIRNEIIKEYDKPHSFSICHYVVKNNRIYRKCYGQHVGFKIFSDSILLSLTRKVVLPDFEFFMNLGDWPLVLKNKNVYPIFSWCGSNNTIDIILPTYDITQSSMESMGSVMLDMLSIQGNIKTPWKNKTEKVFWRGRDSRRERDLSDIVEKINWIKQHDDDALRIAKAGRALMREVALSRDVFCYHVSLFREWSRRLQNEIKVLENMEEVLKPEYSCECSRNAGKNKKNTNSKDEF